MERADVALVRDIALIIFALVGTGFAIIAFRFVWSLNRKLVPILTSVRTITENGAEASEVIAKQVVAPLAQGAGLIALAGVVVREFLRNLTKEEHDAHQQD